MSKNPLEGMSEEQKYAIARTFMDCMERAYERRGVHVKIHLRQKNKKEIQKMNEKTPKKASSKFLTDGEVEEE